MDHNLWSMIIDLTKSNLKCIAMDHNLWSMIMHLSHLAYLKAVLLVETVSLWKLYYNGRNFEKWGQTSSNLTFQFFFHIGHEHVAQCNRPMDLVVQSTSSEGGAVIAFLHFCRNVSTIFHELKFQWMKVSNQVSSAS